MTEREIQDQLQNLIEGAMDALADAADAESDDPDEPENELAEYAEGLTNLRTFDEVGLLTRNAGLVIRTADGSEFQITIVRSR